MNRIEFRNEILEKNGKETAKQYEEFCIYQDMIWEMLLWFADFCDKHDIHYQLAYGSLLGIIRDSGQIPWDYDIDVLIPYTERKKLVELLKSELPDKYYFVSNEVNKRYYNTILRIVPQKYHEAYFHIDVFFMVGTATDEEESSRHRQQIGNAFYTRYYKLINPFSEFNGHPKKLAKLLIGKVRAQKYSLNRLDEKLDKLGTQYSISDCAYLSTLDRWATIKRVPVKVLETILFESPSGTFRIPACYDEILQEAYGDYKKVPPFENRVKEFLFHLEKIKQYELTQSI